MESTMMTNDRMGKLARRTALAAAVVLETASAALADPAGGGFNAPKPDADYLSSPSAFANLGKKPAPLAAQPQSNAPVARPDALQVPYEVRIERIEVH
jgi:hypothetical protein